MRRLPPDLRGRAPRLPRRRAAHPPPGAGRRPRRGLTLYTAKAMPVTRVFEAAAADAAAAPNAPVLVSVFLPGGVDLLDTLVPLHDYGRYADLHKELKVESAALPGGSGLGLNPSLSPRRRRRGQGPLRARQDRLPARDRLPRPRPLPLPLPPLLGDRADHRALAPGWLGRWLDRAGEQRQPAPGHLDGLRPLAGAALGRARRWRRWPRRATPGSGSATCGASRTTRR